MPFEFIVKATALSNQLEEPVKETSKAMRRRWCEHELGFFPWRNIFVGQGIDVGCGDDPIPIPRTQTFDLSQGDANSLSRYFAADSFDWLHSSQCLEHMYDPKRALLEWIKVVRPKGWIIITVPSWELYEHMTWPSRFNGDHRSTWSMFIKDSPAETHVLVPEFLKSLDAVAETVMQRQLDANYNYKMPASVDQTWNESDGVEPFIEFVLKKR
jgi:SAM-dependent methyltransferase